MNTNEFLEFARQCMDDHGLPHLELELDRSVRRLGACHYKRIGGEILPHKLTFSKTYIEKGEQRKVLDTLLHEIAHALCPYGTGHGWAWIRKCKEIGLANPQRCTDTNHLTDEVKVYRLHCVQCGDLKSVKKGFRSPNAKGRLHVACRSTIKWVELPF